MRFKRAFAGSVLTAALAATACVGGQTGGEVSDDPSGTGGQGQGTGGGTTGEGSACKETPSPLTLDETSPLGFSAQEALAMAKGTHRVSGVAWAPPNEAATLDITPSAGTTDIELTVTYEDGDVRYVDREVNDQGSGPGVGVDCGDLVEIGVSVHLKTDNGAFDDTFPATLVASSARYATVHVALDGEELDGSFAVTVVEPQDAKIEQLALDAAFTAGGFSGSLTSIVTGSTPQVAYAMSAIYARWPDGECATNGGIPVSITEGLAKDAWATIPLSEPLAFTWEGGEQTELSLSLTAKDELGCYLFEPYSRTENVSFEIAGKAKTTDGRIDGTWPLWASVDLDETGKPKAAQLRQLQWQATAPAEFEASSGISGVDVSGHQHAGYELSITYDYAKDPIAHEGTFAVVGIDQPECPEPDPNDPNGAPGCDGTQVTDLETATLSN